MPPATSNSRTNTRNARAYGSACQACKAKKRKCERPDEDGSTCTLCRTRGQPCEVTGKDDPPVSNGPRGASSVASASPVGITAMTAGPDAAQTNEAAPLPIQASSLEQSWRNDHGPPPIASMFPMFSANVRGNLLSTSPSHHPLSSQEQLQAGYGSSLFPHETDSSPLRAGGDETTPRYTSGPASNTLAQRISNLLESETGHGRPPYHPALLDTYFVWQGPQHMPIVKDLFLRDMDMVPTGPYYSDALLYAIYAQAARHVLDAEEGQTFADKARLLLLPILTALVSPTIPSIQALLILAGRDLALGHNTSGWTLSGLALRLLTDMGIPEEIYRAAENSAGKESAQNCVEKAARAQLFWSAFCWDKFFAMAMGRGPILEIPSSLSDTLQPKLAGYEASMWTPAAANPSEPIFNYIPQPARIFETFEGACLLYKEIHHILNRLYIGRSRHSADSTEDELFIRSIADRLINWRSSVSPSVLLDTAYLPFTCPPPHLLTLNLLYRTAWILLHKPLISRSSYASTEQARSICLDKACEIQLLLSLHEKSFGLRNITYLISYTAYVAATIELGEIFSNVPARMAAASRRLELILRVLAEGAKHTPGIQRSIYYLKHRMQRPSDSGTVTPTTAHQVEDLGFEDLFALLQPQFGTDWQFLLGESTAQMNVDWDMSF